MLQRKDSLKAVQRRFDYLVGQEIEERSERRGLEQRAAGLMGALLVAFPLAGTVARDLDLSGPVGIVGLAFLGAGLMMALIQAALVTRALSAPRRRRNVVGPARKAVMAALRDDRLDDATESQALIVKTIGVDNWHMVRQVRRITQWIPVTLLALLAGLALVVIGGIEG
jgi:hypothetical protein